MNWHLNVREISKSHSIRRALLGVSIFSILFGASGFLYAAVGTNVKELAEKVEKNRQNVVESDEEKRKILGSLYDINQRMKKITHEKGHLTDQLFQVKDNVRRVARLIAGLEVEIDKQRVHLRKRLRALYKVSGEGYLAILFSRTDALDLDESLRFLKIVMDKDYDLIRHFQENVATYKAQRQRLRIQIEQLVSIEKNIKRKESLLKDEHRTKSGMIARLEKLRLESIQKIKSLRSKSREISGISELAGEELKKLLKPSIFEKKGQLRNPIQGYVVHDFGLMRDEQYKRQLSHKGWLYQAPRGSSIFAVYDGTVVYSGPLKGYGETTILDHGDHYYSVYAHLDKSKLPNGTEVKLGDILGEAGPSTRRYEEGLYFEIRHFSEPEDPEHWIGKKGVSISEQRDEDLSSDFARGESHMESREK